MLHRASNVIHLLELGTAGLPLAIVGLGACGRLARIEGLEWGMTLDQVTAHLGEIRQAGPDQPQKYQALNARLDEIPVVRSTFELSPGTGLRSLAYEFEVSDMTEVLQAFVIAMGSR